MIASFSPLLADGSTSDNERPDVSNADVFEDFLMKIVDAKVIVCSPGRNFVTLKIVTDDGSYGLGDATLGTDANLPLHPICLTTWCRC